MVLHVGDSFAAALGLPLNRKLKEQGLRSALEYETASYIPGWSAGDKLQKLLWKYNPDLVLITLGANELEIVDPEQRIRNIRRIVSTVGDRPCVWIATPLWAGAKNGLMDIIRQNAEPCRYMDTNALIQGMPRVSDGIHPTLAAREEWADVVIDWLKAQRAPSPQKPWALAPEPPPASAQAR
jgi:lysophospholipase L1-like esterase